VIDSYDDEWHAEISATQVPAVDPAASQILSCNYRHAAAAVACAITRAGRDAVAKRRDCPSKRGEITSGLQLQGACVQATARLRPEPGGSWGG
jgi:hypothetical protein